MNSNKQYTLNKAKEKIISFVFGNNYRNVYEIISNPLKTGSFEFELRIADEESHCSLEYWNIYNEYFKKKFSLKSDIIATYFNRNIPVKNKIVREYLYGDVAEEKSLILKFESVSANENVIPLVSKLSYEKRIPNSSLYEARSMKSSFAKTYRQSYEISCDLLSQRTQHYLQNWRVDKTVRIIADSLSDVRLTNSNETDIDSPNDFDILDLELEFIGEYEHFENSLIALIEFLYKAHPNYKSKFHYVSLDFQYYSLLVNENIKDFFISPKVKQINNFAEEFSIHKKSKRKLLIYNDDQNYIEIDNYDINLSNFKDYDLNKCSIILAFKYENIYYVVDIYYYEIKQIHNDKYSERFKYLEDLCSKSDILKIPKHDNTSTSTSNDKCILVSTFDNYKDITIIPDKFYVNLNIKLCPDERSFVLYTDGGIILTSPLLRNKFYIPTGRNELEKEIMLRKIYINNVNIKFKCKLINNYIELIPKKVTDKINTLQEAVFIILEAYSHSFEIDVLKNNEMNEIEEDLFQIIIERENENAYKNVLIYAPYGNFVQNAIKIANSFITYNSLILQSDVHNIITNLNRYHEPDFVMPILKSRINRVDAKEIYALNNLQNIYQIPEVYNNNMNLIITSFYKFDKLKEFVNVFKVIQKNICEGGEVLFNFINSETDVFRFIYNIDKCCEMNNENVNSDFNVEIETDNGRKLREYLKIRPKNKITLIKSTSRLGNRNITKIATNNGTYIYMYGEDENKTSLESQLAAIIMTDIKFYVEKNNEIITYLLNELSKKLNLKYSTNHPIHTTELQNRLMLNSKLFEKFDEKYNNYVSARLIF